MVQGLCLHMVANHGYGRFGRETCLNKQGQPADRSVNICSEDLISPMIFGLKYDDEKLEFSLAQIFLIWGKKCL